MGFSTTTSAPEKPHPAQASCGQKTASRKFFTYPIKTQHKNLSNSLKTSQKNLIPNRKTASGVFYYKFRHYSAELGRWLARDPIEERGGVNLYAFVENDGINGWDRLGNIPIQEDDYPDINDFDVVDYTEGIPFAGMLIYKAAFVFRTDKSNGNPCCIKAYMIILEAGVYIKESLASLEKLGTAGVIGHELKNMRAMNNRIKEIVAEIRARKDVCYSAAGQAEEVAKELTRTYTLKSIEHMREQARYENSEKYGGPRKGQPIINPNL